MGTYEADVQHAQSSEEKREDGLAPRSLSKPAGVHAAAFITSSMVCSPDETGSRHSSSLRTVVWIAVFLLLARPLMREWRSPELNMPRVSVGDDADGCVGYAAWREGPDPKSRVHPNGFLSMNSAQASFELSSSSELLYLISRGSPTLVQGSIDIQTSSDVPKDAVHIDVTASYNHKHAFRHTTVCLLQRGKHEQGVGIFAPEHFYTSTEQQVMYDIHVKLPSTGNATQTQLKHVMTNLPVFTHRISGIENTTRFHSFTVRSTNAEINAAGVSADRISVITSNRPIRGSFESSSSITLHTSNAPIDVDVTLLHNEVAAPTRLDMMTSNGRVDASIVAISNGRDGKGGTFSTIAATSNAPMDLIFTGAPVDSVLLLDGRTTNEALLATLPVTYEGSFSLSNSASTVPEVQADPNPEDPDRRGRSREIEVHHINGGTVEGHVIWRVPSRHMRSGWVRLTTSNAPMTLLL